MIGVEIVEIEVRLGEFKGLTGLLGIPVCSIWGTVIRFFPLALQLSYGSAIATIIIVLFKLGDQLVEKFHDSVLRVIDCFLCDAWKRKSDKDAL